MNVVKGIRFKVKLQNGVIIHTTEDYWQRIVTTRIKEGKQIYVKT